MFSLKCCVSSRHFPGSKELCLVTSCYFGLFFLIIKLAAFQNLPEILAAYGWRDALYLAGWFYI